MKNTVVPLPCGCNPVVYRSILTDLPKHSQTVRVFDPETKAGYLLIFEGATAVANGAHSSVAPTAGLRTCFEGKGGRRRFFLCKQFQAGRCRAHENCNSIHACREAIQQIRAASGDAASDEDGAQAAAREQPLALACQDGAGLEAFELQVSKTEYTIARDIAVGRQAAAEGDGGGAEAAASSVPPEELPQVCLDHEAGHCAAGSLCSRIHVSVKYMKHIRQLWRTPCCSSASCGAAEAVSARLNPPPRGFRIVTSEAGVDGAADDVHPVARLGFTVGLSTLCKGQLGGRSHAGAAGGVLRVFAGKLCRPHARKMCKWGTKCNNLHVCRELLRPALHALQQEDAARAQAAGSSDTTESSSSAPRTSPSVSIVGDAPHTPVARCRVPAQLPDASAAAAAAAAAAASLPPTPPAQGDEQQQRQLQHQQLQQQLQQQEQQKLVLQQQLQQLQLQQQQQQIGALSGVAAGVPNMQQNVVWTVVNPLQQLVHQQQAVQAHLLGSLQMTQMRLQQMQVLQQLLEQNPTQQTVAGFPQLQA